MRLVVAPPSTLVGLSSLTVSGGSVVRGSVAGDGIVTVSGQSEVDGIVTVAAQHDLSVTGKSTVGGTVIGTTPPPPNCSGSLTVSGHKTVTVSGAVCYATVTVSGGSTLKLAAGATLYANTVAVSGNSLVEPA